MADQQPKRPLTAYFIWMGENREAIGKANPDLKSKELVKKLGETWRGITDKSKWEKKSNEAKEQYAKQVAAFEARGGTIVTKKRSKTVKETAVGTKKRKPSADEYSD